MLDLASHDGSGDALGAEGVDEAGELTEREPVDTDGGSAAHAHRSRVGLFPMAATTTVRPSARAASSSRMEAAVTAMSPRMFCVLITCYSPLPPSPCGEDFL